MILAGIDIGTNSLRLLIAETGNGSFRKIHSDRMTTRLGKGLAESGRLSPDAAERALTGLVDFQRLIRRHDVAAARVVGTSALRRASDAREFIETVGRRTGFRIEILSGEEEARLMARGALAALNQGRLARTPSIDRAVVIDIGGGSTEVVVTKNGAPERVASLRLGAVYLTERFLHGNPPLPEELALLRETIDRELSAWNPQREQGDVLIGTAGTVTTLASLMLQLDRYDPERINGAVITRDVVEGFVRRMSAMRREERLTLRGLEKGREDIILAGALTTRALMERWDFSELIASDWGLREGIVLDLADRMLRNDRGMPAAN